MKILVSPSYGSSEMPQDILDNLNIPWEGFRTNSNFIDYVESYGDEMYVYRPRNGELGTYSIKGLENLNLRGIGVYDLFVRWKVIEIPDGVGWEIADYDGAEYIQEKHRTWS